MPIKIECQNCGFKNDLGRVFCVQCGKKMTLERTSLNELAEQRQIPVGMIVKRVVIAIVLLALAGLVALAFWPTAVAGVASDPVGVEQVPMKKQAMKRALRYGQRVTVSFSEAELNGYLANVAKSRQLGRLAIDLGEGEFELFGRFQVGASTNISFLSDLRAPISCRLTGAFDGGRLVITKASIGHLPAIGPLQAIPVNCFSGVFNDLLAERDIVDGLLQVKLAGNTADLKLGKRE